MPDSTSRIVDNTLVVRASMPPGTIAIGAVQSGRVQTVIRGNNVIQEAVDEPLPIAVEGAVLPRSGRPEFVIADNRVGRILDRSEPGSAKVEVSGNTNARGELVPVERP